MGRWIPKIKDEDKISNSGGSLIVKAREGCEKRLNQKHFISLKDNIGLVGFQSEDYILCAKSYPMGWIVSCHAGLLKKAVDTKKKLLMYIGSTDKFYIFEPVQCIQDGTINKRGGIDMVNFDLKMGTNAEDEPQ